MKQIILPEIKLEWLNGRIRCSEVVHLLTYTTIYNNITWVVGYLEGHLYTLPLADYEYFISRRPTFWSVNDYKIPTEYRYLFAKALKAKPWNVLCN